MSCYVGYYRVPKTHSWGVFYMPRESVVDPGKEYCCERCGDTHKPYAAAELCIDCVRAVAQQLRPGQPPITVEAEEYDKELERAERLRKRLAHREKRLQKQREELRRQREAALAREAAERVQDVELAQRRTALAAQAQAWFHANYDHDGWPRRRSGFPPSPPPTSTP